MDLLDRLLSYMGFQCQYGLHWDGEQGFFMEFRDADTWRSIGDFDPNRVPGKLLKEVNVTFAGLPPFTILCS